MLQLNLNLYEQSAVSYPKYPLATSPPPPNHIVHNILRLSKNSKRSSLKRYIFRYVHIRRLIGNKFHVNTSDKLKVLDKYTYICFYIEIPFRAYASSFYLFQMWVFCRSVCICGFLGRCARCTSEYMESVYIMAKFHSA